MTSTAARSVVAGLLLSAAAEAGAVETGIGASAMAGSGGYRRLGLSADAAWTGKRVEPYAWGEGGLSRDLRAFAFGGGAWNNWSERERGKAGLGLAAGRYDGGRSVAALLAELGAENDFDAATLGAGWGLTYGSLAGSRGAPSLEQTASARSRGRRAAASAAEVYSVHSFSVYGRRGLDLGVLGARLGLDFPRYGPRIVSETVSLRLPVKKTSLWVTPAATLEQGSVDAVYFSLSLYCRL